MVHGLLFIVSKSLTTDYSWPNGCSKMTQILSCTMDFVYNAARILTRESRIPFRQISSALIETATDESHNCIAETKKPKILLKPGFTIRPATESDLSEITRIRQKIGAYDVPSVIQSFMKLDPGGVIVAANESGKVLGCGSCVFNGDDSDGIFFGGMFHILPEFQGNGTGLKIYQKLFRRFGNTNCGFNSVPSMLQIYKERGGFPIEEDNWMPVKNYTPNYVSPEVLLNVLPSEIEIQPFQDSFLPDMIAYDQALVGYRRSKILFMSCHEMNCKTFVAFKNGVCVGFGSIKETCLGAGRVGPLYADDPAIAEVILRKLLESFPGRNGFAMMTISSNTQASSFLKKLNCPIREKCHRLYSKKTVVVDTGKIYALFDMNFTVF